MNEEKSNKGKKKRQPKSKKDNTTPFKKDRKVNEDEYKMAQDLLNRKIHRKNHKNKDKDSVKKDQSEKVNEEKKEIEAPQ